MKIQNFLQQKCQEQSTAPGQEPDLRTVRIQLAQRIVELKEALVVGSRKVKLQWEVRHPENREKKIPY